MGMKARARTFKCWACYDSGFVQQWYRELDPTEVCRCVAAKQMLEDAADYCQAVLDGLPDGIKYPSSTGGQP